MAHNHASIRLAPTDGLSKNTYTVSHPQAAYEWIATYLPVGCFDSMCDEVDGCAQVGRSNLCTSLSDCTAARRRLLKGNLNDPPPPPPGDDDHSGPSGDDDHSGPGPSSGMGMGIHCVNSTARPFLLGDLSTSDLEAYFNEKIADHNSYDAFSTYRNPVYFVISLSLFSFILIPEREVPPY